MIFGQKLRKIREGRGITQQELAEKLGYVTNSYVSDTESGHFIPSWEKLKKIAKALAIPFSSLKDLLIESKIEELGIKEPELQKMFRDIPKLPQKEKRAIIETYLTIKEKLRKRKL